MGVELLPLTNFGSWVLVVGVIILAVSVIQCYLAFRTEAAVLPSLRFAERFFPEFHNAVVYSLLFLLAMGILSEGTYLLEDSNKRTVHEATIDAIEEHYDVTLTSVPEAGETMPFLNTSMTEEERSNIYQVLFSYEDDRHKGALRIAEDQVFLDLLVNEDNLAYVELSASPLTN